VATIVAAAEETAERIRLETEQRMHDRIAEGERAAENRVRAAEEEAAEIVESAEAQAARVRETGRADAEKAVANATSEALAIVARAQENADRTRAEGEQAKTTATSEALTIVAKAQDSAGKTIDEAAAAAAKSLEQAEQHSRELLREVRSGASDVRTEGLELVGNLREMGDSLRANAERLLHDVQMIHSRMVAEIDRVDGGAGRAPASSSRRVGARDRGAPPLVGGDALDVPEFIPPG
jgi:vacuolar-type H+-ATPase subunit H